MFKSFYKYINSYKLFLPFFYHRFAMVEARVGKEGRVEGEEGEEGEEGFQKVQVRRVFS